MLRFESLKLLIKKKKEKSISKNKLIYKFLHGTQVSGKIPEYISFFKKFI